MGKSTIGKGTNGKALIRCAIYTRKSSEDGLEQDFNSLDAQRESCEAFILSQKHEGWTALPGMYDDGGLSGGTSVRSTRAGPRCPRCTMTAASPAAPLRDPP